MTTSREDKSLKPAEDKTSAGATPETPFAPVTLDGPRDPADLRPSDAAHEDEGKVRVKYVHHVGDKKPGNHATLPAAEANSLIAAKVAVLDNED